MAERARGKLEHLCDLLLGSEFGIVVVVAVVREELQVGWALLLLGSKIRG